MEKEEIFKKIDEGANLPPSETEEAKVEVQLNSDPIPTDEEKEKANIEVENSDDTEAETVSENVEPELTPEQESVEKMLTQSQVDEIVGRTRTETRDKTKTETLNGIYSRYGVKDEAELDEMMGKAQKSDLWKEDFDRLSNDLLEARNKIAMYESGINPERYEDARLILTGKGMEITTENLIKEMETHPEWKNQPVAGAEEPKSEVEEIFQKTTVREPEREPEKPVSKIAVLGNENPKEEKEVDERKTVRDWYNY